MANFSQGDDHSNTKWAKNTRRFFALVCRGNKTDSRGWASLSGALCVLPWAVVCWFS